jgi:hypothetical protein
MDGFGYLVLSMKISLVLCGMGWDAEVEHLREGGGLISSESFDVD